VQGGPSASATADFRSCLPIEPAMTASSTHIDPLPLLPVPNITLINTIRSLLYSAHSSLCAYPLDFTPTRPPIPQLRTRGSKTLNHKAQCSVCGAGYQYSSSCMPTITLYKSWHRANYLCSLRTNASPVYLVLFISATYFLNRPCVYCSLLLFILVVALFDFHTPWFDPPLAPDTAELALNGTIVETAGVLAQAANHTAQAIVRNAVEGVRGRMGQVSGGKEYEWVKGLLGKKEWKIQCLDVLIRV
jgi:hypothetical protein